MSVNIRLKHHISVTSQVFNESLLLTLKKVCDFWVSLLDAGILLGVVSREVPTCSYGLALIVDGYEAGENVVGV